MLEIDEFVGSLKAGKEADIVLWSGNPYQFTLKLNKHMWTEDVIFRKKKTKSKEK